NDKLRRRATPLRHHRILTATPSRYLPTTGKSIPSASGGPQCARMSLDREEGAPPERSERFHRKGEAGVKASPGPAATPGGVWLKFRQLPPLKPLRTPVKLPKTPVFQGFSGGTKG